MYTDNILLYKYVHRIIHVYIRASNRFNFERAKRRVCIIYEYSILARRSKLKLIILRAGT